MDSVSIPQEILEKIFLFIYDFETAHNFYVIFPFVKNKYSLKKLQFCERFHPDVVRIFGDINNLAKYPYLPYQYNFCGIDYIDNIRIADVTDNVMIGRDEVNRYYITFKYLENGKPKVLTIFERYSSNPYIWTNGTAYGTTLKKCGYFINNGIVQDYNLIKSLTKLVKNNFVLH